MKFHPLECLQNLLRRRRQKAWEQQAAEQRLCDLLALSCGMRSMLRKEAELALAVIVIYGFF